MPYDAPGYWRRKAAKQIRLAVQQWVHDQGWNSGDVAERLGVSPMAWERMLQRDSWDMPVGWDVAERLGLQIEVKITRGEP